MMIENLLYFQLEHVEENTDERLHKTIKNDVYHSLGAKYSNVWDFKKALEYYELCLSIAKEVGDKVEEGHALFHLGTVYRSLGDFKTAMECYQQSLSIAKDVGAKGAEAGGHGNLGKVYHALNDFEAATQHYQQCISVAKEVGEKNVQGTVYGFLGKVYCAQGDLETAKQYHKESLSIAQDSGEKKAQCTPCRHLGIVHHFLGDFKTAMQYHQQSLSIAEDVGDKNAQHRAYHQLGRVYSSLGDLKKQMEYYQQSLSIAKDAGDKTAEGRALGHLGEIYSCGGDFKTAMEYHQQSLSIAKGAGDGRAQGDAYSHLGNVYTSLGDLKTATQCYQQALSIAIDVGNKRAQGEAYNHLSAVCSSLGNSKTAMEYAQQFHAIAKDSGIKEIQAQAYHRLGLLYSKDQSSLPQAEGCLKSSVEIYDTFRHFLHSHDDWLISVRNYHRDVYKELWLVQLNQGKIIEALSSAERGRAQALMDLMTTRYGLELLQSSWSAENAKVICDILPHLPSQTAFLAIGNDSINFWVLYKGRNIEFRQKELVFQEKCIVGLQSWIEEVCKNLRSVRCVVRCLDVPTATGDEVPVKRSAELESLDRKNGILKDLYDKFIGPIADLLHGDEINIVPDGPLGLVPFSAVINQDSKYLSETFTIRLIPSLTSLKLIAECPEGYHSTTGALLVGDPWVGVEVVLDGRCTKLPPLPCARKEVEMIGKILDTEPLTGERATKAEVLRRINSVALVHVAAHGCPGTGDIILSFYKASRSEDILLTKKDILNLSLRARLVVLSCCHSARGEVKAEGLVGIARAFLGAGARSVVVTLWAINDEATQEFMKHFYQRLSEGQCASKALNCAMKHLRESDYFNDVSCWAPFALIGDDVIMDFSKIRWESY